MAGIGIELRKLFSDDDDNFSKLMRGVAYSTIISAGAWLITILTLILINSITVGFGYVEAVGRTSLINSAAMFSFLIAQIAVSPWFYLVTRFVSDAIYQEKKEYISASYYGAIKIILFFTFIFAVIYMRNSKLPTYYNWVFIYLSCMTGMYLISLIYLSLSTAYKFIIKSYFRGMMIGVIVLAINMKFPSILLNATSYSFVQLVAYTIGMTITTYTMFVFLYLSFESNVKKDFEFIKYINPYWTLMLIGVFYTFAVLNHTIVNWIWSKDAVNQYNVFWSSSSYDIATFISFFITIPLIVYFFVFVETRFSFLCHEYYLLLNTKGKKTEIEDVGNDMKKELVDSLKSAIQMQLFVSVLMTLVSKKIFLYYKMDSYIEEYLRILAFAGLLTIIISMIIILLLYLDARVEALIIAATFFFTTLVATYLARSDSYYIAIAYLLASIITFIVSDLVLTSTLRTLEYRNFFKQNFELKIESKKADRIISLCDANIFLVIAVIVVLWVV